MLKLLALICLAPFACSKLSTTEPPKDALVGGHATRFSDVLPPVRFRGESIAIVYFVRPATIQKWCPVVPDGATANSCTVSFMGAGVILSPLPCERANESYARTICHEGAHVNGWGRDHEF